ncbi:MAG: carbamoyltransferase [Magnetococcales bacterium]|nr:carbamoyltransferase [Magnetococcales bacterium]
MKILGISALDKDATVSVVEEGEILFAAGEERFSRKKQHAGFPYLALEAALSHCQLQAEDIDRVAYPFMEASAEVKMMRRGFEEENRLLREKKMADPRAAIARAKKRIPPRSQPVQGLPHPNKKMEKGFLKERFYHWAGTSPSFSGWAAYRAGQQWLDEAIKGHAHWQQALEEGLTRYGLEKKLSRFDHHHTHAVGAYHMSGFDRALVVTLDGYGSGLAGSVSLGEGGKIRRLDGIAFPFSLGTFYETVTSSLGFNPDRHAGKIVGLAAYGDPALLSELLLSRFDRSQPGHFRMFQSLNVYFSRALASHFPMVDVAAAYQAVLELVAGEVVAHWAKKMACDHLVLAGGVTANVKMNQRLFELEEIRGLFVYPNMGDGGTGSGAALALSSSSRRSQPMDSAYLGPAYSEEAMLTALNQAGLTYRQPPNLAEEVAALIHSGKVVARFSGRMEYGPRALGNRSILYHARQPDVNQWLNQRLGRTEFMPFAPVTLWEARERCYHNLDGAELAAQFMTVTFDCTDWMKATCPAAVHVDGTARPQLIRRGVNPDYYDILKAYEKLSGIPSLINTSFNMHEEPIVCTPQDAVRAFVQGDLDVLVMGPFLVNHSD